MREVPARFTQYLLVIKAVEKKAKLKPTLQKRYKQNNASSLTSSAAFKQDFSFCTLWSQEVCKPPSAAV